MIAPRRLAAFALAAAIAAAGCGSKSDPLAMPATGTCAVAKPIAPPPYGVEFQLRDNSTTPLFLFKGCGSHAFGVSSCASGFTDHLGDSPFCACPCDQPRCGIVCGGCEADEATQIVGGDSVRLQWDGVGVTAETKGDVQCATRRDLPAGRYRVSVQVYDTAEAALARTGGRAVMQDFALPAPAGLVDVPLAP